MTIEYIYLYPQGLNARVVFRYGLVWRVGGSCVSMLVLVFVSVRVSVYLVSAFAVYLLVFWRESYRIFCAACCAR